jgi:hypothetical protein
MHEPIGVTGCADASGGVLRERVRALEGEQVPFRVPRDGSAIKKAVYLLDVQGVIAGEQTWISADHCPNKMTYAAKNVGRF